jgi:hypothetical protein
MSLVSLSYLLVVDRYVVFYAAPHPDIALTNVLAHIDLHRLEATEGGQCGVSDSQ